MIVTGASSGIGRALSLAAARAGYALVINARRADRLDEVARTIRQAGGRCEIVAGDITATDDACTNRRDGDARLRMH